MRIRTTVTILAAVVLGCLVTPVRAGVITGSFDGNATQTPTGTPGIFSQNFAGDGEDSTFGAFTVSSNSTVDFSDPPSIMISNGQLVLTFADGTLFGDGTGTGTGNGRGSATFSVDFMITGGTGLFQGATGDLSVRGTLTLTSPTTETVTAAYNGPLTLVPEPGSLAMFAPIIALFAAAAIRGRRRSSA